MYNWKTEKAASAPGPVFVENPEQLLQGSKRLSDSCVSNTISLNKQINITANIQAADDDALLLDIDWIKRRSAWLTSTSHLENQAGKNEDSAGNGIIVLPFGPKGSKTFDREESEDALWSRAIFI